MDLLQQFQKNWNQKKFAFPGQTVLLAVSGGIDSMVMADLFYNSKISFAIAHCNFQLRGTDADLDEQLVVNWAKERNIIYYNIRFDTKQKCEEWKKGVQETARILRYEWLNAIRVEHNYTKIVTAHHANDNVETLLINLFKGTGISGLHGIPEHNDAIMRPLLFAQREDIKEYAQLHNIVYREDVSNAKDTYLRNAVRLNIIPVIQKSFPQAIQNVSESIKRFAQAETLYRKAVEQGKKKLLEQRGQDYYIPVLKLKKQDALETICYEIFVHFGFTPAQLPHILALLDSESGHFVLSATYRVIRNRDFLVITTIPSESTDLVTIEGVPCNINTGKHHFHFSIIEKPPVITPDNHIALIDGKRITFPIILRKWRIGDYFYPLGMNMKKKKVSRFLIDQKVALHDKEHIWVLECDKRIAWVAGMRLDERFKVKDTTEQVLKIEIRPN